MGKVEFTNYVKDIERYYLTLKGEGIMLSPKGYELILRWKMQSVPKETVFRGIRKAFAEQTKNVDQKNRKIRRLTQCRPYVEELIRKNQYVSESEGQNLGGVYDSVINDIIDRLNGIIKSEKREIIRKEYIVARNKILNILKSEVNETFKSLKEIEAEFFEGIFQSIPEKERQEIIEESENNIHKRARFMTEKAKKESVLSFRNESLVRRLNLSKIIDYAQK